MWRTERLLGPPSAPRERRLLLFWFFVFALLFAGAQSAQIQGRAAMDTRQYVAHSYMLQGVGREEASRRALEYFCDSVRVGSARKASADLAHYRDNDAGLAAQRECRKAMEGRVARNAARTDVTGYMALFSHPRVSEIFATRPGYPLYTIPFTRVFGLVLGLWAASLVATVLASGLVVLILRMLGVCVPVALLGQVLYYALPTGKEAMLPLCEGLLLCALLAALAGCVRTLQGHIRSGTALSVSAFAGAACVKYAQTLLAVAGIAAVTALFVGVRRVRRREISRPHCAVLAVTAAFAVALQLVVSVLGLPGTRSSLQDLLTVHYTRSMVPDPLSEFLRLSVAFWREWLRDALVHPLVLLLLAAGAWGAFRHHRAFGCLIVGIAVAGVVNQAGHPETSMGPRLMVMAMLLPVCGIPLLVESHARRYGRRGPDAVRPPRPGRRTPTAEAASR
ncbi:hypothetical protein [Streptomyces sp. NEAU-NA10]|uniref:hypothetical protein n=1 Tax=Streptomyces sp. NEAU-NA10 TaxID=3416050 RepID=UPI003CC58F1C